MATELALERSDNSPIGSFSQVQAIIEIIFPGTKFGWTTSGQEKLRIAAERKITLPDAIRQSLENLPSLLEGQFATDNVHIEFGLGHKEPVWCIYVEPRGVGADDKLAEFERQIGGHFVVSGEEKHRVS